MNPSDMIVRAMTEADWPQVAAIYEQGIVSHKATFAQQAPSYETWDAEHHKHTRQIGRASCRERVCCAV